LPLKVAGVWIGVVGTGEGWSLTHHEGVLAAKENLPYVEFEFGEGLLDAEGDPAASNAVDEFIANGAEVVIANSFDYRDMVKAKSEQYPNTKFLICSGQSNGTNVGAFFGHLEQAWYVGGQIAARKTASKHIGFVGSYITPEVVRHLNAFTLGARSEDPAIQVEVRWTGFWYDPGFLDPQYEYTPAHMGSKAKLLKLTAEEFMTAKLIDSGADVLGHQNDNQLLSRYVAQHTNAGTLVDDEGEPKAVWTIANDNRYGWRDQAGNAYTNAIGAAYWNWESMYTRLFEQIHQKKWNAPSEMDSLIEDSTVSTVGFELSTAEEQITDVVLRKLLVDAQNAGPEAVFRGPWNTTGQRPNGPMPDGEVMSEEEWRTMCFFVEGVVERQNPNDMSSPLVAAKVPDDTYVGKPSDAKQPAAGGTRQPTTAPEVAFSFVPDAPEVMWSCKANQ
jgi:basic membrane lipoprotein Med (substrate-binding protein (PBP1-ABC) superfamily)